MKKYIFLTALSVLIPFLTFAQINYLPGVMVSTYAGSNADPFSKDGQGVFAGFNTPCGIAVDASGTMYVADATNHSIRKVTSGGNVSTFAGSTTSGNADGQGSAASFNHPEGIAVDAAGNVYVSDTYNHRIRKITPGGFVTTLAGSTSGSTNGQAASARFKYPNGLVIDASGNLYVADGGNYTIRKIASDGTVSTLAGSATFSGSADGQGSAARFGFPYGITVDAAGTIYVADRNNHSIRKITPGGLVSTVAGSTTLGSADGQGSAAGFNWPTGVVLDASGNLYIADSFNSKIRKITSGGLVSTWAVVDGTGAAAIFNSPTGLAIDASGNIFVADAYNREIRKITSAGLISNVAGYPVPQGVDGPVSLAFFYYPVGIAIDASGNMYVTDQATFRLRKIAGGYVSTLAGDFHSGTTDGQGAAAFFYSPAGIAKDAAGNLYIADQDNNNIRKVTPGGLVSTLAGGGPGSHGAADGQGAAASFWHPRGIAVDGYGNVFVSDQYNNRIRKITPSGYVTTFAGGGSGFADGQGTAARFSGPRGLAVDAANNIYVCDTDNNRIRKITPSGLVSTIGGNGSGTSTDGQVPFATFYSPNDLVVDAQGNVYVTDYSSRIRRITPSGEVSTVAGSVQGSADGIGSVATFYNPTGIALDPSGNLFVVDATNKEIRKITLPAITTSIIGQSKANPVMQVYPNPAKDILTVTLPEGVSGTLTISDVQGRIVLSESVDNTNVTLSTALLHNGMYVLNLVSDQTIYVQQLIITR